MEAVKKIKLTTLPGDAGRIHPPHNWALR